MFLGCGPRVNEYGTGCGQSEKVATGCLCGFTETQVYHQIRFAQLTCGNASLKR